MRMSAGPTEASPLATSMLENHQPTSSRSMAESADQSVLVGGRLFARTQQITRRDCCTNNGSLVHQTPAGAVRFFFPFNPLETISVYQA